MHTKEFTKWLKAEFPTDDKHHKQARESLDVTLNGMNKALKRDVVSIRMKKKMIMYKAGTDYPVAKITDTLTGEKATKFDRFLSAVATDPLFSIDEAANWLCDYCSLINE